MQPPDPEVAHRRLWRRLGLGSGLLIGLALALGTWALDAVALSTAHVRAVYPSLLLGALALTLLGALAGWLASLRDSALWGALVWFVAAGTMVWTVGHLPYEGRSLLVWLADHRFWGLPIYAFSAAARARMLMAAFFVVLCLAILGLLQNYRLEGIAAETDARDRLTLRAWVLMLLPLPIVFAAGLAADSLVNSPERTALSLVHEAIRTGRTYPGDLFELSLKRGVNYNAIAGVRDRMSEHYALSTGEVSLGRANSIVVVADFDNGAWIRCQVTADQLFHCSDASLPYTQGLAALLTTGEMPPDCRACTVKVEDAQRAWLLAQHQRWLDEPRISRQAQWGSHVLMRAESPAGDHAVECLFRGLSPVLLVGCWEGE